MFAGWKRLWPAAVLAIPLAVEAGWAELIAGLVVLGAAAFFFDRFPVAALSVLVAAAAVPAVAISPLARAWPVLAVAVFSYLAGRRITEINSLPAWVTLAVLPVSVLADGLFAGLYNWFVFVLVLLVAVMLPWLGGRYRRQRAELVAAGWERAALLERQQQLEIGLERARIARDMHDSLGHEWGLIALRAAALEVSNELPSRQRELAGELRADVAHVTERLHEIIGMLDTGKRDIVDLVERAIDAGMSIEWEPPEDVPVVAYRVVQEGLTNAAKHAPGATVTIRFEGERVTVANGPGQLGQVAGRGSGIAGLRDRVEALGGTVTAGPQDGGWQLSATLPHAKQEAESKARRRLARAIRIPALAGLVIVVLTGILFFVAGANNRLDPVVFDRIAIGMPQAEIERQLPAFQILDSPDRMLPPPPDGAACQLYWATEQRDDRLYFRLCFAGDRLVLKEVVPR
jgi:signal transduction histidine kinase